jgi:hypothetical protein
MRCNLLKGEAHLGHCVCVCVCVCVRIYIYIYIYIYMYMCVSKQTVTELGY